MPELPIPDFYKRQPNGKPWPDYKYEPFPRYVGLDAEGNTLIANSEEEVRRLKEIAVFPKNMGKDRDGKDVIAQSARDLEFFKGRVVTPPEDPAVVAKREADRLAAEAETKRKAEAYDKLMAEQKAASNPAPVADAAASAGQGLGANAQNQAQAPTGLKKSTKAA